MSAEPRKTKPGIRLSDLLRRRPQPERPLQTVYGDFTPGAPDETGHVLMPLSAMLPGDTGHIVSLCECCEARQHLLELGFTPGTPIEFIRRAPLSDPLTVRVRGYQLSLRRQEAEAVTVRRCPPELTDAARRG